MATYGLLDERKICINAFDNPPPGGWVAPSGMELIEGKNAVIGKFWNGTAFVDPPPPSAAEIDADREQRLSTMDAAVFRILYNHEQRLRKLTRALRASSAGANTQATTAGLPTAAQSGDITAEQFRNAVKDIMDG